MDMYVVLEHLIKVVKDSKYKELFGDRASNILSLYEHKHDHTHSQDGTIDQK